MHCDRTLHCNFIAMQRIAQKCISISFLTNAKAYSINTYYGTASLLVVESGLGVLLTKTSQSCHTITVALASTSLGSISLPPVVPLPVVFLCLFIFLGFLVFLVLSSAPVLLLLFLLVQVLFCFFAFLIFCFLFFSSSPPLSIFAPSCSFLASFGLLLCLFSFFGPAFVLPWRPHFPQNCIFRRQDIILGCVTRNEDFRKYISLTIICHVYLPTRLLSLLADTKADSTRMKINDCLTFFLKYLSVRCSFY